MKEMRRVLALVLCAVMLVGYVPVGAIAAEAETTVPSVTEEVLVTEATSAAQVETEAAEEATEVEIEEITFDLDDISIAAAGSSNNPNGYVDAALFFSDLHIEKSEYSNKDYSPITNVFGAIAAQSGFDFSSVTSIGDAYAVNAGTSDGTYFSSTTADLAAAIKDALSDANGYTLNFTWSDHDRECTDIEDKTGLVYSGPNYYIYAISMSETATNDRYSTGVIPASSEELQAALKQFTADVEKMDHTKPLFIASHQPLLDNRNDNGNAYEWAKVINSAAEKMDIVFLFGHNHKYDAAADYFYAKGDKMKVCKDSSGNYAEVTLNFTHACAGYLDPTTSSSTTRKGVAVVAEIDEKAIYLTTYNNSGVYSGNYALVDKEIQRDHAEPVMTGIRVVNNKDKYTVGDALDITVYGIYGSTEKQLAAGQYTVEGFDSATTGVQTVTVGCEGFTATLEITVEKAPTVEDIRVTYPEICTLGEELALTVTAIYSDGTEKAVTGYTVTGYDKTKGGVQGVVVTYGEKSFGFNVAVWARAEDAAASVFSDGITSVTVTDMSDDMDTLVALEGVLEEGFVAYDIVPENYVPGTEATIVMPAPEGANVVYYVPAEGEAEEIPDAEFAEGKVTFVTDHFSVYAVGRIVENLEIPAPDDVEGEGEITDTTTKTVYVLSSSISAGKEYLIVNSNSAGNTNRYALANNNGSIDDTGVTIKSGDVDGDGDTETYIELDDAADELWTVSNSYRFQNNSYYLRYNSGLDLDTRNYTNWSYSSNRLSCSSGRTYYLRYNNEWTTTTSYYSATSIYFYIPTEVEVETTTTVSGTYSICGDPEEITGFAIEGYKAALGSILIFAPEDGQDQEVAHNATYAIYNDPNGIIGSIDNENDAVTLSGKEGQALIKVTATVNNGQEVSNYILVNALPKPTMQLHEYVVIDENGEPVEDPVVGSEITTTIGLTRVDETTEYSVYAKITSGNEQIFVEDADRIEWTSSDTEIATVEGFEEELENGLIYFTGEKGGTLTITATYKDEQGNVLCTDTITFNVELKPFITPSEGTDDFPEYPDEGAVRFDKTATAVGNYTETGITQVEIAMTGVPYGKGVDVVVVVDTSSSMKYGPEGPSGKDYNYGEGSRYYIMKQSLGDMLNVFAAADSEGRRPDIDLAIVDFNGYSDSNSGDNSISGANLNDRSTDRTGTNYGSIYTGTGNGTQVRNLANGINSLGAQHFENTGSDAFDAARINEILNYFNGGHSGTNYDFGIEAAYKLLAAKKAAWAEGETRDQYVIFLTDGAPFRYNGFTCDNSTGRLYMDRVLNGYYKDSAELLAAYPNYGMTEAVAAMYDPYNGTHRHRMAEAIKGEEGKIYQVVDHTATTPYLKDYEGLGAKFYSIGFCIADDDYGDSTGVVHAETSHKVIRTLSSGAGYYWENVTDRTQLSGAFTKIAKSIVEAATNVAVEDKIGNSFSLNLSVPGYGTDFVLGYNNENASIEEILGGLQDFYIQVVEYELDANKDRTGTPEVLEKFTFGYDGSFKTHTVNGVDICTGTCSHITTSASTVTNSKGETSTLYTTTAIRGTYFNYVSDQNGEVLTWNMDKISSTEVALQYLAHLDKSTGYDPDAADATKAGTHYTNEYATITYDNYKGNRVQQTLPVPQMTWNGAQVSYVFYLVNDAGRPVNRAGREIPFAEAIYVTDVHTESVVWNTIERSAGLEAEKLAHELVPSVFELYDQDAAYNIHVYQDEDGYNLNNHFVIVGDVTDAESTDAGRTNANTTIVFNNKADAVKYSTYGTYVSNDENDRFNRVSYLCKSAYLQNATFEQREDELGRVYYEVISLGNGYVSVEGETQVPVADLTSTTGAYLYEGYAYYADSKGVYTIVARQNCTETYVGFDYSNTTVAFAVVWKPELKPDTVVVDYGLDVAINVITNDAMAAGVTGVMKTAPANVEDGYYDISVGETSIIADDESWTAYVKPGEDISNVYFRQNSMAFHEPAAFYYEAGVNFYTYDSDGNAKLNTANMFSSVTVIPATTIYYEDNFLTLNGNWEQVGTTINATQAVDRPGETNVGNAYDANNVYGYDGAYTSCSTYSLGSVMRATVSGTDYATAEFDFFGTGFDVISLTSSTSGTMTVKVKDAQDNTVKNMIVDTYYGYEFAQWYTTYTYEATYTTYTFTESGWKAGSDTNEAPDSFVSALPASGNVGQNVVVREGKWVEGESTQTEPESWVEKLPASGTDNQKLTVAEKKWTVSETENTLYQIPVIKISDLAYGKYHVTITAAYNSFFDHTQAGSYEVYLDAIRIYDPTGVVSGETNETVSDAYAADNEGWPQYQELRELILSAGDATSDQAKWTGAIFIDHKAGTYTIADYENYGPNNELYLAANQAIVFELKVPANVKDVQIGLKSADGDPVFATMTKYDTVNNTATESTASIGGDSSAADRYYSIGNHVPAGGTYTLGFENTGSGILSITNIKFTYSSKPTDEISIGMTKTSAAAVLKMMNDAAAAESEPEVVLDAELEVTIRNKNVKVGSNIAVKATTSADAAYLMVNGQKITKYSENKTTGERSWSFNVKAEEAGNFYIEVTAYSAEDEALETVTETVQVAEKKNGTVKEIVGQMIGMLGR